MFSLIISAKYTTLCRLSDEKLNQCMNTAMMDILKHAKTGKDMYTNFVYSRSFLVFIDILIYVKNITCCHRLCNDQNKEFTLRRIVRNLNASYKI